MCDSTVDNYNEQAVVRGGDLRTKPPKTLLQKEIQRQLALAFKAGATYTVNNRGVARGSSFEEACTQCATEGTRVIWEEIKKVQNIKK